MIPSAIVEFFNDIGSPWSVDFKKQPIPTFEHEYQLLDWIIHRSQWPYLPITLPDAPYSDMLREALALEDLFVAHRSAPNELAEYAHRGWRSICLHGEAWNKTQHYHDYPENAGKTIDEIQYSWCPEITERCPETTRYFKELFPYHNYQRLRYMWLEPNGYIQPHRDRTENFLQPMNIALNNPDGCVFKMHEKGYVPFKDGGSASLVDIGNLHAVWNNSDTPRIHMIAHAQWKPKEFTRIVINSLKELL